jgi:hypothetical protein
MTPGTPPPQAIDSPLIEAATGEARNTITAATWLASVSVRGKVTAGHPPSGPTA